MTREILLSTFQKPIWLIPKQTHDYLTEGSSTLPPSTTITHPPSEIRLVVRSSGEQHWTLREAARQLNKQQFIGRGMNTLPSLEAISGAPYWCWEILMKRGEGLITPAWDDVFPCTKTHFTWPNKGRVHLNWLCLCVYIALTNISLLSVIREVENTWS